MNVEDDLWVVLELGLFVGQQDDDPDSGESRAVEQCRRNRLVQECLVLKLNDLQSAETKLT